MDNLPIAPFARAPKPDVGFKVLHESSSELHLSYDMGRADISSVSVGHSHGQVTAKIPTVRTVLLVEKQTSSARPHGGAMQSDFVAGSNLKWSTCAAHELFEFFANHLIHTLQIREQLIEAPMTMIRGLVVELCSRRDMNGFNLNAESFRSYLPLSAYQTLLDESQSDEPTDGQAALAKYLGQFSQVDTSAGKDWSPQAYELHGNSVIQFLDLLPSDCEREDSGVGEEAKVISHAVDRQITGFSSEIINEMIVVKVQFAG